MDGFVIAVSPAEGVELLRSEAAVAALIERSRTSADERLQLDDAWAALHFLLTGEVPLPKDEALRRGLSWDDAALENVLMGGAATPFQGFYGAARYLDPAEVRRLAPKLAALNAVDFADRFEPAAFRRSNVQPAIWDDEVTARRWLAEHFWRLVRFYGAAAERERGLLIYML